MTKVTRIPESKAEQLGLNESAGCWDDLFRFRLLFANASNDNAGTLAEHPPALITALEDLYALTDPNLEDTEIARGEKTDSYQELKKAILDHGAPALRACRKYLYAVLPDGRNDELLIEWGFEPYDMPTSQKPNDQKFVETLYDPTTDMITIRLEEDILADEFILSAAKNKSPAPPDWVPQKFDIFATSDTLMPKGSSRQKAKRIQKDTGQRKLEL